MKDDHNDLKDKSNNSLTNFGKRIVSDETIDTIDKYEKMGRETIAQLVPNKTDADYAAELRKRIIEAYQPLFLILEEADNKGFNVNSTVGKDFLGRFTFAQLQIMKVY